VSLGLIDCRPLDATVPMPLLIDTSFALVVVHVRLADWPRSIRLGSTVSVADGRAGA
jgi:hypothetical protein